MTKKSSSKPAVTSGPSKNGGFEVRRAGNERATLKTETKKEAVEKGREIAKAHQAEHVIKGKNGQIQEKNSYGNDPFPPKG